MQPRAGLLCLLLPCQEPGFQGREMLGALGVALTEAVGEGKVRLLKEAFLRVAGQVGR